jgi:glycine oxidase
MKVVVIGAGVAGLSAGWRLAEAGVETVVLERAQPGRAASWAAAGMLVALLESGDESAPEAVLARQSAAAWPRFAVDVEEQSGMPIHYRRDGMLLVASGEAEADALRARAAADASLQFADPAHAHLLEPLLPEENFGALRDPAAAQVDNRALAKALAAALRRCGGRLVASEAAVLIETDKDGASAVRTPFARHDADAIVLAAGAWSGELGGVPKAALPPVRPVKGQMIALAPPGDAKLPVHLIQGQDVYLVPRHDRLLVGATVEEVGFDSALTRGAADRLRERAVALLPALSDWRLADHWAGLRPGSPDGRPILGATALPRLFALTGQYRNGILFAPVLADALCGLVLGRSTSAPESGPVDLGAFDARRFAGSLAAENRLG